MLDVAGRIPHTGDLGLDAAGVAVDSRTIAIEKDIPMVHPTIAIALVRSCSDVKSAKKARMAEETPPCLV